MEQLHHGEVQLRGVPARGVAHVAAVDVGRPHGLVEDAAALPAGGHLLLALEGDADEAGGAHVLHEPGGGDGHLEEEVRHAAGVVLERQGDAGLAVAEQGAGGAGAVHAPVAVGVGAASPAEGGGGDVAPGRGGDDG